MKRKIYDVTQGDNGWQGKARGNERATVVAPTKEQAIQKIAKIARDNGNAQVVIRKTDGTIQSERTYGNDPRSSKG